MWARGGAGLLRSTGLLRSSGASSVDESCGGRGVGALGLWARSIGRDGVVEKLRGAGLGGAGGRLVFGVEWVESGGEIDRWRWAGAWEDWDEKDELCGEAEECDTTGSWPRPMLLARSLMYFLKNGSSKDE